MARAGTLNEANVGLVTGPATGISRGRIAPTLLAVTALLAGLPTAVFAVTDVGSISRSMAEPLAGMASVVPFTPASVDPAISRRVAAKIAARGQELRFTPGGVSATDDRTVTVAIRLDHSTARAITVRNAILASGETGAGQSIAGIAPTRFNLGVARGYKAFAKPQAAALDLKRIEFPDLANFRPREGIKESPSRLQPRIALEAESRTGRAPRTLESAGEQAVDLGAGYRLSRNLNFTAGVRLSQDRDRIAPLTDAVQDNQAVYIGTQFRF